MSQPLAGKTALVTGASRGIGEAIARRLAADGARLVLVARGREDLERVGEAIEAQGASADVLPVDVTDRTASASTFSAWERAHGPAHILVNNAGGNVRKAAEAYDDAEWDHLLALSLTAPFTWSRLVLDGMRKAGWGRIVNVASVAGLRAIGTGAPYAAGKAGMIHLTRVLAREWAPHGITVNAVAPWYVETPLTEGVLSNDAYRGSVLSSTPRGRVGQPADVAAAVAYLCGPEADWVTGTCLPVDGGFVAAGFFPPEGSRT